MTIRFITKLRFQRKSQSRILAKIMKITIYVLQQNFDDQRFWQKPQKPDNFEILAFHHLKFLSPTAWV